ncbi:hypothetical protein CNMCM7691_006131 [Aspergillus felis]|uniref:O-methyltransferase dimerisation domain-containing protein n=1 Tax=Aspergillus felis TaxID=1287682 RepID=A0A8H6VA75_9EURO|nr:hypothetical protein CNMCM7691_006131 [Aspergillus felis]
MTISKETTLSAALVNVDDFLHSIEGINRASFAYDGDRIKALAAAYALVSHLETPWDTVARLCMTEPALGASLKVARDLQLFEKWHQASEHVPHSAEQLAELVGCDPFLLGKGPELRRILRHLTSTNVIDEVSSGQYKQTVFSKSLLQPVFGEWINYL